MSCSILRSGRMILHRSILHHARLRPVIPSPRLTSTLLNRTRLSSPPLNGHPIIPPIIYRHLSSHPPHTLFTLPALSPTMETGRIAKWNKSEGDSFIAGDVICEIETDKATMDFEAQDDGLIAKILVDAGGEELKVGVPICVVVEEDEYLGRFDDFVVENAVEEQVFPAIEVKKESGEVGSAAAAVGEKVDHELGEFVLLPSARHISQSKGLDATVLYPGSGKGGRVTKGDVLLALQQGVTLPPLQTSPPVATTTTPTEPPKQEAAPTPPSPPPPSATTPPPVQEPTDNPYEDIPNNNMRKVIARRLTESKQQVPHFYTTAAIDLDPVLNLRKVFARQEVKLSVNDYIVKAASLALRDVPEMNAKFHPTSNEVKLSPNVDICVAVATPGGLITPIVPHTDKLGLSEINSKIKDLATRAREGKLLPEEYQGGSFTISNLGMFGIDEFSAVINLPQCAILAVGGGAKKLVLEEVVDEEGNAKKGLGAKTVMSVRLSADRRVVDEGTAGLFLQAFRYYLEKPNLLLL